MISLGALCQLDVSVQSEGGESVEDKRLGCHALHRRVSILSQTKCFHHVKSWNGNHMTETKWGDVSGIQNEPFSLVSFVWGQLVVPLTMLFLMVTSGQTATQQGSVESLWARQRDFFFNFFSQEQKLVSLWALYGSPVRQVRKKFILVILSNFFSALCLWLKNR